MIASFTNFSGLAEAPNIFQSYIVPIPERIWLYIYRPVFVSGVTSASVREVGLLITNGQKLLSSWALYVQLQSRVQSTDKGDTTANRHCNYFPSTDIYIVTMVKATAQQILAPCKKLRMNGRYREIALLTVAGLSHSRDTSRIPMSHYTRYALHIMQASQNWQLFSVRAPGSKISNVLRIHGLAVIWQE